MKLAIMQPYAFPYIGYFQLINAVDAFVVYDNIQFSKKGWINRNRILSNGKDEYFTFPLKKGSDYLNVDERKLADNFPAERVKLLRKLTELYKKAPNFDAVFYLLQNTINVEETNLFNFIHNSLLCVCEYLSIHTRFIVSSSINIDHELKAQDKVISICKALNATEYLNPIGGVDLYSKPVFEQNDIELKFIQSTLIKYPQFKNEFVPWLSIIDVMMFNSKERIIDYLQTGYTIK